MSRRHEPVPPGQPRPGDPPIDPDDGALPPPGAHEEEDEQQKTPAPN